MFAQEKLEKLVKVSIDCEMLVEIGFVALLDSSVDESYKVKNLDYGGY